jgi:hypothetical protein
MLKARLDARELVIPQPPSQASRGFLLQSTRRTDPEINGLLNRRGRDAGGRMKVKAAQIVLRYGLAFLTPTFIIFPCRACLSPTIRLKVAVTS